jgi:hypothetical protein
VSIHIGDKVTVYHTQTGERREVEFDGIHVERPYVLWTMSGVYCVDMESGLLKTKPRSKRSTMWKIAEADQVKLQEALQIEKDRLRARFKKNKGN